MAPEFRSITLSLRQKQKLHLLKKNNKLKDYHYYQLNKKIMVSQRLQITQREAGHWPTSTSVLNRAAHNHKDTANKKNGSCWFWLKTILLNYQLTQTEVQAMQQNKGG